MTVMLRPHHLLCLLTYIGKGYNDAFIANFNRVISRLQLGEASMIVFGPDDICAPLLYPYKREATHCFHQRVIKRDRLVANDIEKLLGYPVSEGKKIIFDHKFLRQIQRAFTSGKIRQGCHGCEWSGLCSSVAANHYIKTVIQL